MKSMNPGDVSEYDINHHIFHKIQRGYPQAFMGETTVPFVAPKKTPAAFIWDLGWHPKMTQWVVGG